MPPAAVYAAKASICAAVREPEKPGMLPAPFAIAFLVALTLADGAPFEWQPEQYVA